MKNLAGRLIPAMGDFGYDAETAEADAVLGTLLVSLMGQPITHVYSDQGWVRVRNISVEWVAQNIDRIEAALGGQT